MHELLPAELLLDDGSWALSPRSLAIKAASEKRVEDSRTREVKKRAKRSSRWPALERRTKKSVGACEACGSKKGLQLHHVQPYHLRPDLELEPSNLMVFCMAVLGWECHLYLAHAGSFRGYNASIRVDAIDFRTASTRQRNQILARAKKARAS